MTEGIERRRHHRRLSVLSAQVVINDQTPALPCTVQNLSSSGAHLAFATVVELPPTFVLKVPSLDLRVEVRVAWSGAERHGVTFVWPHKTAWS